MHRAGVFAFVSVLSFASAVWADASVQPDASLTFERDVRPILKAHCFDCHGEGEEPRAKLDLRLRRSMTAGGKSGPAIVPGAAPNSLLLQKVRAGEMPKRGPKLSTEQIAILEKWIAAGAPTARLEPERPDQAPAITEEERRFWSFQPIQRPPMSKVVGERIRTPIDAFLAEAMAGKSLTFSPDAEKRALLRRVYVDLVGLPPTPLEVEAFLADPAPDAYERIVEKLLSSPRYGERWARHWLDAAGYADSEGYSPADAPRPDAYRYRDYVIRSLNADKPFDRFTTEQLAGDELAGPIQGDLTAEQIELFTATGYLRMAVDGTADAPDLAAASNRTLADTIDIVSTSLLGLTVACAQCHDHRFDPIPQEDYYRLRAVFEPALDPKAWRRPAERRVSLYTAADRAKAAEVEAQAAKLDAEAKAAWDAAVQARFELELAKLPEPLRQPIRDAYQVPAAQRTPEQKALLDKHPTVNVTRGSLTLFDPKKVEELKQYETRIAAIRATKPPEGFIRVLNEPPGHLPATHVLHRGDPQQPRQPVTPGDLTIAAPAGSRFDIPADDPALPTSGRRLAYAKWLTGGNHPLVPRVIVNRVWMHYFGRGLVGTPADFGALGERPTHPQLLDWLAAELIRTGWSLKRLHRLIVTSTAYRQSSLRDPARDAIDQDNRYYARMPIRRLDAEALRDTIQAVAGTLHPQMFGPPVPVAEDADGQVVIGVNQAMDSYGQAVPVGEQEFRRSIYIQSRRSLPLGILRTFDAPVMETNCKARPSTTVPTQSLMLMNSKFILDHAAAFAQRLRREAGPDPRQQVRHAWLLAFARPPTEPEQQQSQAFLAQQLAHLTSQAASPPTPNPDPQLQALTNLCQTLLTANEFLYLD